jgi:hypothetical protein
VIGPTLAAYGLCGAAVAAWVAGRCLRAHWSWWRDHRRTWAAWLAETEEGYREAVEESQRRAVAVREVREVRAAGHDEQARALRPWHLNVGERQR